MNIAAGLVNQGLWRFFGSHNDLGIKMKKVNRFTSRVTDERQLRAELGFFWKALMMAMGAVAKRSAGRTTTAFESKNECYCQVRVTQGLASRYNAAIELAGFACWVEARQRAR
ncbi:hypothetical protein [Pseudomonas sp. efr-133-TYG-103a]|jgi:hypothetical protein|uniref:hypothetical protein n=1 Tax=Pseudomonas sp. efr-133-TYG-103a TaxID=3040308 RepID=UPI002556A623|nr:hypothetical protein [Pseudomonas sp. efr-133-TYG-103a]